MKGTTKTKKGSTAAFAIIGYMICSASMLVVNKLAVYYLPAPSFVLLAQLIASAAAVKAAEMGNYIKLKPLTPKLVSSFFLVPMVFVLAIFTNIKTLQYSNIETFIVFRASTPILISFADYLWLGRELPSGRSALSLVALVVGAIMYVYSDAHFQVEGYVWVLIWYIVFSTDQIYIKHKVDSVKMTNWDRVYITNLLAAIPLLILSIGSGELKTVIFTHEWSFGSYFFITLSCALGTAMSYFAFLARSKTSATYFTILGNICKIASVILNITIWDKHASPLGLFSLGISLLAAYFYQQAPMRFTKSTIV